MRSSWIPSRSEWGHACVLSGRIWPVVIMLVITALGGIVLSMRRGIGLASDRTKVTVVPLSLVRSMWHACPYQNMHTWQGSTSPHPFRGHDGGEVMCPQGAMRLRREEGVAADPDLSVWTGLLGLARPRSFELLLAGVLWAAWPAN